MKVDCTCPQAMGCDHRGVQSQLMNTNTSKITHLWGEEESPSIRELELNGYVRLPGDVVQCGLYWER